MRPLPRVRDKDEYMAALRRLQEDATGRGRKAMLNSTKVDKGKLLTTLQENKAKHVAEFDEAVVVYREKAEKALRKRASDIRDGKELQHSIGDLPVPRSFEKEYDQAIAMVEWETEPTIELDQSDFMAFVLDEWSWRGQFAGTTSIYNAR